MLRLKSIITLFLVLLAGTIIASPDGEKRILKWQAVQKFQLTDQYAIYQLYFEGAIQQKGIHGIPRYSERIPIAYTSASLTAKLIDPLFEEIEDANLAKVVGLDSISESISIDAVVVRDRKVPFAQVCFLPYTDNH